ncbi:hypothetical protein SanaruYs_11790 [Chryseotalea sanaruensis]|uniref:Anti-sigma factor n=1 Tax=Chryseotalea sanaruensis TaxID=2482724 RepID=A0A401U7U2_9BACT|nr:hypothetical protein SanaruYs_11790 [Chryseotalea sanaruensis]
MIKTFTQNDLIRFLYHETTEKETEEIKHALLSDPELNEQFNQLCSMTKELDGGLLKPSSATVLNILSHVRSVSSVKR